MDNWRKQKGYNYKQQEMQRSGSYNKRPPSGSWQATVPLWEKKFCTSIGSVSWGKLLETKKYMHLYDNVVQWNDSAGEEAFNNAKSRFWAEINGLPCDISLPGPDIYIDEIDWNSEIDPELILDLERDHVATGHDEEVSIHGNSLILDQPVPCTGWGDEELDQGKATNSYSRMENWDKNVVTNGNTWESSCPQNNGNMDENGWGNCWNDTWGSNKWDNNNDSENFDGRRTNGVWGTRDFDKRNGEVDGCHMSRYKTSRFLGDDHHMDHGSKNEKWRKVVNHVNADRKPTYGQWKTTNNCQPLNHHRSGRARHSCNWEKPIA